MKTRMLFIITILFSLSISAQDKSFYDFTVQTIDGKEFNLSELKGKKVLVVNVASKCGYAPQYKELEELYKKYGSDHFTIIGFPANNFKQQEPGTNQQILDFCTLNYGVTFPMMAKISVKGENIAPLYKWLTEKSENGKQDAPVKWNFQKFMIDENGNWIGVASSQTSPMSDEIVSWIEK